MIPSSSCVVLHTPHTVRNGFETLRVTTHNAIINAFPIKNEKSLITRDRPSPPTSGNTSISIDRYAMENERNRSIRPKYIRVCIRMYNVTLTHFLIYAYYYIFLQNTSNQRGQTSVLEQMNKYYYFTRTKGLFRICYPRDRPPTGKYNNDNNNNTTRFLVVYNKYHWCTQYWVHRNADIVKQRGLWRMRIYSLSVFVLDTRAEYKGRNGRGEWVGLLINPIQSDRFVGGGWPVLIGHVSFTFRVKRMIYWFYDDVYFFILSFFFLFFETFY